ncbi:heptaprenyl diphosphate synthase [Thermoclostridium stercorarium subsp. leptospartum DSM 9219]|uniref:Heptaprenyl diphosphate synthase n=1 Tax=Thermoclostridium stercorarium subsp. leptospartum DSM 9219 TaxID=1346611 RepID=A0A1B1YNT5_THEST|nr:polyprenyl synthetase family protein [Thermoclostridium stercorarium]ANX02408.1 heptaprenyl diphosphate synthase [Thermoclostridium stercorarium subsp. leptospartum DSM 9219]
MLWDNYPEIKQKLAKVEEIIQKSLRCRSKPFEEFLHTLSSGGKRLRPAFTILAAGFGKQENEKIYDAAAGIEILHMATLVHDDVIDDADTRRGKATANKLYGDKIAVYMGDFLLTRAVLLLSKSLPEDRLEKIAGGLKSICEAEIEQFFSRFDLSISLFTYLKRIARKTSALFAFSCGEGAFLSGCDEKVQKNLVKFGFYFGMAFQMYDDVMNLVGDEAKTGKPRGNDIKEGIITIPLIIALRKNPAFAETVSGIMADKKVSDAEVGLIINEILNSGGIDDTRAWIDRYLKKADMMLEPLPDVPEKQVFRDIMMTLKK